jgi:hypothetical protein
MNELDEGVWDIITDNCKLVFKDGGSWEILSRAEGIREVDFKGRVMFKVEAATERPRQTVYEDLSDYLPLLLGLKELQVDLLLQDSL